MAFSLDHPINTILIFQRVTGYNWKPKWYWLDDLEKNENTNIKLCTCNQRYTLIYNSYGLSLAEHEPFESIEKAIEEGNDVVSHKTLVQRVSKRKRVADTDIGKRLKEEIKDLEALLKAYREGVIEENL